MKLSVNLINIRPGKLLLGLLMAGLLAACASQTHHAPNAESPRFALYPEQIALYVGAAIAPDGRLWRVATSKHHVYVDYSDDNGKTFSEPVLVNADSQRIKTSIENRPSIFVDDKNFIFVTYPAEGQQPATIFFSSSTDGGKHFSKPQPLSDKAAEANTLQATIAVAPGGSPYIFWHDDRDRTDYRQLGNSVYYTTLDAQHQPMPGRKASDVFCECCRLAVDFDVDGEPVVFGRFIYEGVDRDHGLLKPDHGLWRSWRVTRDQWRIEACPEQGPALAIAGTGGTFHVAWFTQGGLRKGLFYAHSTDHGQHFSTPLPIGDLSKLPHHPAIFSRQERVALSWMEFDGERNLLMAMLSSDAGRTWSDPKLVDMAAVADRPAFLIGKNQEIFLAWNNKNAGFKMSRINWE